MDALQERIEDMRRDNARLRAENDQLRARLAQMKELVDRLATHVDWDEGDELDWEDDD